MGNESGTWIMYGVDRDDPECIHTVEEAIKCRHTFASEIFAKEKIRRANIMASQLQFILRQSKSGISLEIQLERQGYSKQTLQAGY